MCPLVSVTHFIIILFPTPSSLRLSFQKLFCFISREIWLFIHQVFVPPPCPLNVLFIPMFLGVSKNSFLVVVMLLCYFAVCVVIVFSLMKLLHYIYHLHGEPSFKLSFGEGKLFNNCMIIFPRQKGGDC